MEMDNKIKKTLDTIGTFTVWKGRDFGPVLFISRKLQGIL